ncbi:hypothetical protein [uncultured Aquimarina sp.]|uniref:hypothetical protein n=1 Tax=uncultured Aquimarina sp. TaxID=575652 RepID=UPI002617EA4F|nr:hypothetical protein [uncultured Aquimarina sp.]
MEKLLWGILFFSLSIAKVYANNTNDIVFDNNNITFPNAEVLNEFTTRIPFKLIDHLIVIEAALLNKKGNFIIDTGSETLILNKIHFPTKYSHRKKRKETSGVLDIIEDTNTTKLKEFILQNFNLKNKASDIIDLSHIEKTKKMNLLGIIGYSILKDYEVFIDMHLHQITLTKVDKFGNTLDKKVYAEKFTDSISFKLKKHTIVLDTYINKQKLKFGLDSAAEYNQINKNSSKKVLKYFFPSKRIVLTGASKNTIEVMAGKLYRVRLSETTYCGPMITLLTNLTKMSEAFGTQLDGILGYEFLRQKRTIINYQKEKLYFVDYPIIIH